MILTKLLFIYAIGSASIFNSADLYTSFVAKEYCSCRFVVKQSPKVCLNEAKAFSVAVGITEDLENKRILARNLLSRVTASFNDDRTGCSLD